MSAYHDKDNITPEQATEHLKDFLSGMHQADHTGTTLASISGMDDWPALAHEEKRRRTAQRTLGCLPDHLIKAIANGEVDLSKVALEVLQTTP